MVSFPTQTLGVMSAFDSAVTFLRSKYQAFQDLGRKELPVLRKQATAIWGAANAVGNASLARRAEAEFNKIAKAGADWEIQNDRLQTLLGPLSKVGITLGALPALWVVSGAIAAAVAITALFVTRDKIGRTLAELVKELPPDQAAELLLEYERLKKEQEESDWAPALITVAVAAVAIVLGPQLLKTVGKRR